MCIYKINLISANEYKKAKVNFLKIRKTNEQKFDNINEDELNTKSNENVYVKNTIMANIIKRCKGEKKEE